MRNQTSTLLFILGLIAVAVFGSGSLKAQYLYPYETKVDSIDITHYDISLDVTDFTTYQLYAHTKVFFAAKVNGVNMIDLDLIGLGVDSIKDASGNLLTYTPRLLGYRIDLGNTYNIADSTWIEVFYHGSPISDPSFGGFYFNSQFAFAVGIDINDVPHNAGKNWFPCFDNFVEKSTFAFHLTIPMTHSSSANGDFDSTTINPDTTKTDHWHMPYQNSTFVTSICVSQFTKITQEFTNYLGDTIPCYFWARPADTANVMGSLVNLEAAFHILENHYGPYPYDHIGYSFVPLAGGAMEHTMNIAYPLSLTNGNTTYQHVAFHELGHAWLSNSLTPRTAEDIWMKEGIAVYAEHMFDEYFVSEAQYDAVIRNTHKQLLWTCHWDDQGYWPLSGIPQALVYGTATYDKSADIFHTMRRGYLGDTVFFQGLKDVFSLHAYEVMDAAQFRDALTTATGYNLDNFFDAWVFQGGWPHVSIDSIDAVPAGPNYNIVVNLKQKLVGRTNYSLQVPITITLRDNNWNTYETTVWSNGANNSASILGVPFLPTVAYLNRDENVSHAVTANYKTINATGTSSLTHANMTVTATNVVDSCFMVVEHNWAAPDAVVDWSKGFTISPQRYWRVDGIWTPGSTFNASVYYNGRTTGSNSKLDDQLITGTEDSLIMLYRPDRTSDWDVCAFCSTATGGTTADKIGNVIITGLQKGEYALALKGQTIGIEENGNAISRLYPNPTAGIFNVECYQEYDYLTITNVLGMEIFRKNSYNSLLQIDGNFWGKGMYMVNAYKGNKKVFSERVIVQ